MISLSFHKELYDGFSLDEAIKIYNRFGSFERAENGDHWVIHLSSSNAAREERLARELANYVLGLTIERSGQSLEGGPR